MRQAGFIAAAGTYALKNNIERLESDHNKAQKISSFLKDCSPVTRVIEPETNIVVFEVDENYGVEKF